MSSVQRVLAYLEKKGMKKSEFYLNTGISNGYLDKVKELGADKIESIINVYPEISLMWLVTGKGEMIEATATTITFNPTVEEVTKNNSGYAIADKLLKEPDNAYNRAKMPAVVTVDISGRDNIVYVPVKARAGYLMGYGDPTYIETLPALRLPGLSNGTYRMFEVEGPSMAPTISSSDRVIGEWVEDWEHIRDNRVYVIVHKQGIAVKRVINRIKERGVLYLKSDTIAHKSDYPMIEILPEDILEVWYSRLRLSSDFREPSELYQRMSDVEINTHRIMKHLGLK